MKKRILVLSMLLISAATISAQIVQMSSFWDARRTRPRLKYSVNKQTNEKVGSYKEWSESGNLLESSNYKKNELDGKKIEYWDYPGLHPKSIENFKDGHENGWSEYHDAQVGYDTDDKIYFYLKSRTEYKMGKETGNKVTFERERSNGIVDTLFVSQVKGDILRLKRWNGRIWDNRQETEEEYKSISTGNRLYYKVDSWDKGKQIYYELNGDWVDDVEKWEYLQDGTLQRASMYKKSTPMRMQVLQFHPDEINTKVERFSDWKDDKWVVNQMIFRDTEGNKTTEQLYDDNGELKSVWKRVDGEMIEQDITQYK